MEPPSARQRKGTAAKARPFSGGGRSSAGGRIPLSVAGRLILAGLLFAGSTGWALTRFNRPDPFRSPALFSWSWWVRPLEINAPARLPVVSGTLTALAVGGNGREIFAAGQGGMLLRYSRSSQVWERIPLPDSLAMPAPAPEDAAGKMKD